MEAPDVPVRSYPIVISPRALAELENANKRRGKAGQSPLTAEDLVSKIYDSFLQRQANYSSRNELIYKRRGWFEGDHWADAASGEEQDQARLVFNYTRNIVLRFVATLTRTPKPRVPRPVDPGTFDEQAARNRERFLLALWPELKKVWGKVELNASKCSYGVFQVMWDPSKTEEAEVGRGEDVTKVKRYVVSPFKFKSIKPETFYPVYKTFDAPDDFLFCFIHEPDRLTTDLELKYGITLQQTGLEQEAQDSSEGGTFGTEPTTECIKYWDENIYAFIGVTKIMSVVTDPRTTTNLDKPIFEESCAFAIFEFAEHGLPRIPIWVLSNIQNADYDPTDGGSISDVDDIIGLNQHYNWIVSEEADEIVTHIHRPLIYYSDSHQQDPTKIQFGPGQTIPVGSYDEERLEMLSWTPEPGFVDQHLQRVESSIKELSFLSDAGFGQIPSGTSGVAARVALTPLEQIIELKLPQRQEILRAVCEHLLRLFEQKAGDTKFQGWVTNALGQFGQVLMSKDDVKQSYYVDVDYGNLLPRDDNAHEQNETYKFKTGVQSLWDTMDALGVEDPDGAIKRLKLEMNDPELNPDRVMQIVQAKLALMQLEPQPTAPAEPQPGQGGAPTAGTPLRRVMPGTAQPGTRPPQAGPSMNEAPPVPGNEAFPSVPGSATAEQGAGPGPAAPFMPRSGAPNQQQLGQGAGPAKGGNPFLTGIR